MSIDDFPELLKPLTGESKPTPQPQRRKGFALGTADDARKQGYEVEEEEELNGAVQPVLAPAPVATPNLAQHAVEQLGDEAIDSYQDAPAKSFNRVGLMAARAASILPELSNVTAIDFSRRAAEPKKPAPKQTTKRGRKPKGERVTRVWLDSLSQRQLFVAINMPVSRILRVLDGHVTVKEILGWMDEGQDMGWEYRTILTLYHLLDRRSQYTKNRLPERPELEAKVNKLPIDLKISQLLGDTNRDVVKVSRYGAQQLALRQEQIANQLQVVAPKGDLRPRSNNIAGVGIGRRSRPLGEPISKPNSYCYKVSKASVDENGNIGLEPHEVMQLLNRAADMERRYGVAYTLTRRDRNKAWGPDNISLKPSEAE